MELPHGLPQTWGEPCDIRQLHKQWYRGVMTALPKATDIIPSVWGRGKIDGLSNNRYDKKTLFHECYVTDRQMVGAAFPKLDTMRWSITLQRIHVTLAILLQGRNLKAYMPAVR